MIKHTPSSCDKLSLFFIILRDSAFVNKSHASYFYRFRQRSFPWVLVSANGLQKYTAEYLRLCNRDNWKAVILQIKIVSSLLPSHTVYKRGAPPLIARGLVNLHSAIKRKRVIFQRSALEYHSSIFCPVVHWWIRWCRWEYILISCIIFPMSLWWCAYCALSCR